MHFNILTLYPEFFTSFLAEGLIKRALDDGKISIKTINFRKYGLGKHQKVDAPPYGGGAGMVLRPEPIINALRECEENAGCKKQHKILISPQGSVFNQEKAKELSRLDVPITLICGRFEGFDERIRIFVDEEISIGDFILMGGELAATVIVETVSRLIPGVIGNKESLENESFNDNLLEYSQYTRPYDFLGNKVPDILKSGNHGEIKKWRKSDSMKKTKTKRLDLFNRYLEKAE
ncbi:tRNA (guanosine(37)-N1)-methyltransferase TrmD [bacterium]|nr:tRNA (guanosine(37)-N1)-methyltransferase TrmD [bacterium]